MDNNKKAAALHYEMDNFNAPKMTAYGERLIADKIIQIAQENKIPIKQDKDMIEILSQIQVNQEIPPELYKAVAEIFSFIYDMAKVKNEEKINN